MRLLPFLSLLSVALASPLHDQITFNPHGPSSLIPSTLPTSISRSVLPKLLDLPLDHLSQLESHIGQWTEPRLVRLRGQDGERGRMIEVTEGQKSLLTLAQIRFVDVTDDMREGGGETIVADFVPTKYPSRLTHNSTSLAPLFKSISLDTMKAFLTKFTSFHTRYYRSQSGRDSQVYLLEHLKELHKTLNPKAKLTFREFQHEWIQKTIIVRWEPETRGNNYKDEEVVILSAHQDSTNSLPFLPAPGADDDASGTVTLISTLTQLLSHKFSPVTNPVEFHFYSAEEGGLLGSGEVAKEYREAGKKVRGMFHMDVVAYVKPGTEPVIGMITDGTDYNLVQFMKLLVDEYATIPYAETACGYQCSDFASFTKYGFPSTCLAEGRYEDSNPGMHSMKDNLNAEGYSLEHIREFVRVAIGYAVELGGMEKETKKDEGKGRWRME